MSFNIVIPQKTYIAGDELVIAGSNVVDGSVLTGPATFVLKAPNGNLVTIGQFNISNAGFSYRVIVGGPLYSNSGTYTVTVTLAGQTATATFEFSDIIPDTPPVTTQIQGFHVLVFKEITEIHPRMRSVHRSSDLIRANMILRAKSDLNHIKVKTYDNRLLTLQMNPGSVAYVTSKSLIFDDNETTILVN